MLYVALALTLALLCSTSFAAAPEPLPPVPTRQQVDWQRGELTMFIHFGVNTFTDREWGEGSEDEKIFNPAKLDCRQWARAAKDGGFRIVILTAKHHDGFCLWPSRHTEHSVKNSPWRDGKGDVVREFVEACRAEGMKPGLYLSPWDRHEKCYGDSPRYNEFYRNQLTELLTHYGPIAEVWFDGACGEGPNGKKQEYDWPAVHALVRKLQPDAVMFSDAGPDIRWIGNEKGIAGDPCWSTVDPAKVRFPGVSGPGITEALQHGDMGGSVWRPGEADVSIRPGWFWHAKEDTQVRSVENLIDLYFQSVGRNSLLLLNVPPNRDGLLADADVQRLADFRAAREALFNTNLAAGKKATASNVRANDATCAADRATDGNLDTAWATDDGVTTGWLEVDLGAPTGFEVARIREDIRLGQRVSAFHLEYFDAGNWKPIVSGTTIGCQKLERFPAITAQRVRLVIDKALACPVISEFALFSPQRR